MYLSRIRPQAGFVVSQLLSKAHAGDVYAQHQFLWSFFPDQDNRDFLFRYEQTRQGPCYYLLSTSRPTANSGDVQIDSKPFNPKLAKGDTLAYVLRANPTRTLVSEQRGARGKRVDVLMHAKHSLENKDASGEEIETLQFDAARNWLLAPERQKKLGVEFVTAPTVTEHLQHQTYSKKSKVTGRPIQFSSVNFEGLLQVNDPGLFISQIIKGIGRAKAMGCGLMMIRRTT